MYTIEKVRYQRLLRKSVPAVCVVKAYSLHRRLLRPGGDFGVDGHHSLQQIVHNL